MLNNYKKSQPVIVELGNILIYWLRGQDSNLRPSGYEPDELPLLHPAIFGVAKVSFFAIYAKFKIYYFFGLRKTYLSFFLLILNFTEKTLL